VGGTARSQEPAILISSFPVVLELIHRQTFLQSFTPVLRTRHSSILLLCSSYGYSASNGRSAAPVRSFTVAKQKSMSTLSGLFTSTSKPKNFQDFLSHRIIRRMYEVLNINE
jgi:hypothetical protein